MGTRSYFRKARNTGNPSHCPTISEVKAANGDFTDSAAARVQTSRGMPKMQPSTLTNIAAVTKRCLTSEPRQCIQMDSIYISSIMQGPSEPPFPVAKLRCIGFALLSMLTNLETTAEGAVFQQPKRRIALAPTV